MAINLPLEKMSLEEKLQVMEAIWEDLTRDQEKYESPAWHEAALKERREQEARGEISYIPWEEAKAQLRRRLNEG
jgi:putative addiction module component (TIGR02574 family)